MEYSSCLVRLRCSRSYPMLRWEPSNDPCRFSDDIRVNCTTSRRRSDQHRRKEEDEASSSRYIIPIDKLVIRTEDRSPSPPPPVVKKKACRRTLPKIAKNEDVEKLQHPEKKSRGLKDTGRGLARLYEKKQKKKALGSSRPPPPATLFYNFTEKSSKRKAVFQVNYGKPVTVGRTLPKIAKDEDVEKLQHLEKKGKKKKKKSGGGVKEIARALSRLFKKKKQKKRALRSPPPPPPPATMFYNFFEESRRRKSTVHSVTTPPPPPLLLDSKSFSEGEDDDDDGLLKPAAPPPVPPFEVEKVKFPVSGDYVLVSSERWEGSEIVVIPMRKESRPSLPLVLYESPEVDADADIFIARFHEKLRLEKMNS